MTPYDYKRIPLDLIDVPKARLRDIKVHRVETIAKDIAIQGQLQPILVVEEESGRFTLGKGLQRLEAIRLNKGTEIDARVTSAAWINAQQLRLQTIMATLNREDFTALERCEALSDLKTVYEELYPETKNGGDRKSQAAKNKDKNQNEIFSFSKTAADATGLSRRSIEIAVATWTGLAIVVRQRLRGTWIERKAGEIRALSETSLNIQNAVLDLMLSEPPQAGSVADAVTLAEGRKLTDPTEKAFKSVIDKWKRFPIGQKRTFIAAHRDEILRILREEGEI